MDLSRELIEIRRDLHQIPEPAFQEYKTSKYIEEYLIKLGYHVEIVAKTGILAFKKGRSGKRPICFRSDMDALEVEEKTGLDYASKNGFMHACGHDGHMTILLGFARYLSEISDINRSIVLLFQPGEENAGGADVVLNDENFQKYNVEKIFGIHLQPEIPEGMIGSKPGPFMAQIIDFDISIEGVCSHGAQPHKGVDAIYVASKLIDSYQSIISRNIDPMEPAVLSIGKINGGTMRNQISNKVTLEGTLRTFNMDVYEFIKNKMIDINNGLQKMFNVIINTDFIDFCPPVVNDEELFIKFKEMMDKDKFIEMKPMTISEDFGFYQLKIPGLFLMLGIKNDKKGFIYPLHSSQFNFNENVLVDGVEIYKKIFEKSNVI
ncbi:MAG: amidohydrolase [Bacillota bacterium]|jgi:hippurate hydrolase/N-acetyldiaminopimelate deacetylase|nr:amidohydrolase [Bacillota bacterium]